MVVEQVIFLIDAKRCHGQQRLPYGEDYREPHSGTNQRYSARNSQDVRSDSLCVVGSNDKVSIRGHRNASWQEDGSVTGYARLAAK
jgi:hypothetical protein